MNSPNPLRYAHRIIAMLREPAAPAYHPWGSVPMWQAFAVLCVAFPALSVLLAVTELSQAVHRIA